MDTNEKKHAYLIIAHHQFQLLEMLIKLLDHKNHDFYIHIDQSVKEFDFEYFKKLPKMSKLYFTKRLHVRWGGHSQIKVEQLLLEEAIQGGYGFYHLLSGVDLPLKKADEIYRFFEANHDREFLYFCSDEFSSQADVRERVSIFHFMKNFYGRDHLLLKKIDHLLARIQRNFKVDRMKKAGYTVRCGANWFSITHELAKFICSQKKEIKKYFYHSYCADEVFLHTLVYKKYGDQIPLYRKELGSDYMTLARLIDWKRGNPYTFKLEDFDELMNSDAMFARKFDYQQYPEICHRIYEDLMERTTAVFIGERSM